MTQTVNNPTILITGGTGFAGSHLVESLLEKGLNQVHVTSYGPSTGFVSCLLPEENVHELNLTDFEKTSALINHLQPDQIYHLAALSAVGTSFEQIDKVLSVNSKIQLSLLQAVKQSYPQARVLNIGSALEYQPQNQPLDELSPLGPVNPYGVSKVTQDMLAYYFYRHHNLNIVRTRSFNHIGERQAPGFVVPDFCLQIAQIEQGSQKQIEVGNLKAVRDFTDVKDTVQAYILLMETGAIGEVYNVGSGKGYSIQELLDKLISLAKTEIAVKTDPARHRPVAVEQVIADNSKINSLGWKPKINFEQTLARTLDYYREQVSTGRN